MNDIKVTAKHNGETLIYTDAANRHEVTICRVGKYYFGWYYVEEEENSYMGKTVGIDGVWSAHGVIAMLINYARKDFGLRYGRAEEMIDLLCKILEMYPRD